MMILQQAGNHASSLVGNESTSIKQLRTISHFVFVTTIITITILIILYFLIQFSPFVRFINSETEITDTAQTEHGGNQHNYTNTKEKCSLKYA
jgi:hypothetical protein